MKAVVSIIMGSTSDMPVMKKAAEFLDEMEIPFEINALSAHRTPQMVENFATNARKNGIKVIIAGAGGAAHLPGVVAAFTTVPVIGVPCRSSISIDGWDSIAHIRIMYRIDFSLNVEIDLLETYSCETIGDLIDLIRTKAGE